MQYEKPIMIIEELSRDKDIILTSSTLFPGKDPETGMGPLT